MLAYYLSGLKKIFSVGKIIIFVSIIYLLIIGIFSYFIHKDKMKFVTTDLIKKNRAQIYKTLNNSELQKTKDGRLMLSIYKTVSCGMIGEACTNNPIDGNKNFHKSLFGFMSNLIALPYTRPPASGTYWAIDGLKNAGFIPKTYAAEGIGLGAIKPFANLWKVFRDVAYMILVLILVAIGFMIMFRRKLNPQTVISVESALPRIVITLLLITFSFAIAGFLIDLMYVVIAITTSIISNNNTYYDATKFTNNYLNADMGTLYNSMFPTKNDVFIWSGFKFLFDVGGALLSFTGPLNGVIRALTGGFAGYYTFMHSPAFFWLYSAINNIQVAAFSFGDLPGTILWIVFGGILTALGTAFGAFIIPPLIIGLIVLFTIIFMVFRIFFMLFKSYLQIILLIILGPIILLFEAVPGKSAFSFWFKHLIAELLTFPIVVAILLIGYVLVNTLSAPGQEIWTPPFLIGLDANTYALLLGMGLIFLIPSLVKLAKEVIGVKDMPIGIGLGTFFAGGAAVGGGLMGTVGQVGSLSLGITALTGKSLRAIAKNPLSVFTPGKEDAA